MKKQNITWTSSDKARGSRRIVLQLLLDRMDNVKKGEGEGIYFFETCRASISTLPILPRDKFDPEDVDTNSIDHAYDMVRYRVLDSKKKFAESLEVSFSY